MKKTCIKVLHLSRETLHDLAAELTGGAWSESVCPRNKVCDNPEGTGLSLRC